MAGTSKRIWKRIINIGSESSEDEEPPSKVHKINDPQPNIEHTADLEQNIVCAPGEPRSKLRELMKSRDKTADNDNQVIKKRRIGVAVSRTLLPPISVCYNQAVIEIVSTCMHINDAKILLPSLSSVPIRRICKVHCFNSMVHIQQVIMRFSKVIEESAERLIQVNSLAAIESMVRTSKQALWASFMTILSLFWFEPYDRLFVEAVESIVHNLQRLVSSLNSAIEMFNKSSLVQHDSVKQGLEAVYESVVNVAFFLNTLMIMKSYLLDSLVFLVIDIGLLPSLGISDEKIMQRSLHLVRSVLKSQIVCWDECTLKIRSAMFQSYNWSKKFSSLLESKRRVHKCTLLLLTLIQSSIAMPGNWVNHWNRDFIQSLSSSDIKRILRRLVLDKFQDEFSRQRTETLLQKALDKSDLIVCWFFDEVKVSLRLEISDQHSQCFKWFLEDLFLLTEDFEWPAAECMLILLCNLMVTTLRREKLSGRSFKFLFECLTSIFDKFNHLLSFEAEDPRTLPSLQKDLLIYLVKDFEINHITRDRCLFYLAVWQRDDSTERRRSETQDLEKTVVVNRDTVQHVVKRIIALRRASDIKNIFRKIFLLKDLNHKLLSSRVMTLVVHIAQLNAKIFLEESLLVKMISCRSSEDSAMQRKALVSCLTAYLLHRPDEFTSYFEIFRAYISDKAITVQTAALQGMKAIGLKFCNNPKVLQKLVLLLKTDGDYSESAAQLFCKQTWLKPVTKKDTHGLLQNKVSLLIGLFAIITDRSSVEELFPHLFRLDTKEANRKLQLNACEQIVDELATRCLGKKAPHDVMTIASFKLLNLFAKIAPKPLVSKSIPLFLSLSRECWSDMPNVEVTSAATEALEAVRFCNQNKTEAFDLDAFMDSLRVSRIVNENTIASGLEYAACLAASRRETFTVLEASYDLCAVNIGLFDAVYTDSLEQICLVQRGLFMLGAFCLSILNHGEDTDVLLPNNSKDVFLMVLAKCFHSDAEVRQTALYALDSASLVHTSAIFTESVKDVFLEVIQTDVPSCVLLQVLRNICEFIRSIDVMEHSGSKRGSQPVESTRDMHREFKMAVVDIYFETALLRFNHPDMLVRLAVLELMFVVGQSDLLPLEKIAPIFVAMVCDPEKCISSRAEKWLRPHVEDHADWVRSAVKHALSMIFALSSTTTDISSPIQGYSIEEDGSVVAKLSHLNSIVAESTHNRYDIIPDVKERLARNQQACIFDLLFCAGNLAHFKYRMRTDVVAIISQINSMCSSKNEALSKFKQVLMEAADEKASPLSVHRKHIAKALKLLLLLELKSFLEEKFCIQKVEVTKFESNLPYKIHITFGKTSTWVSNRSNVRRIPIEASELRFSSCMSSEKAVKDYEWKHCCGRNFSAQTFKMLYRQLRKMGNKA